MQKRHPVTQDKTNPNEPNFSTPQTAHIAQFHTNKLRIMNNELITIKSSFRGRKNTTKNEPPGRTLRLTVLEKQIEMKGNLVKKADKTMNTNCYLRPAWTHNGSIRTDLPLTVIGRTRKKKVIKMLRPGQLCCVGKVYLKTNDCLIRIK